VGVMPTVLVVDDEPDILLMLRVAFEVAGHDTLLAPDGEAALSQLVGEHVDCVILDVLMPVMDGWSVLDGVTRSSDPPPVVVISARSEDRDVRRALGAGAVDYVSKPFDAPKLVALVEQVIKLDAEGRDAHRADRLTRLDG